jgi:hypothetical protein
MDAPPPDDIENRLQRLRKECGIPSDISDSVLLPIGLPQHEIETFQAMLGANVSHLRPRNLLEFWPVWRLTGLMVDHMRLRGFRDRVFEQHAERLLTEFVDQKLQAAAGRPVPGLAGAMTRARKDGNPETAAPVRKVLDVAGVSESDFLAGAYAVHLDQYGHFDDLLENYDRGIRTALADYQQVRDLTDRLRRVTPLDLDALPLTRPKRHRKREEEVG